MRVYFEREEKLFPMSREFDPKDGLINANDHGHAVFVPEHNKSEIETIYSITPNGRYSWNKTDDGFVSTIHLPIKAVEQYYEKISDPEILEQLQKIVGDNKNGIVELKLRMK
jgi:hypothetical protein